jgi:hypothetical protein
MHYASLVIYSRYQCSANLGKAADLWLGELMAIPPTDIRILFTNYDIITYFFKPGFLPELEKQIRCFPYVLPSDVQRLQQLHKSR